MKGALFQRLGGPITGGATVYADNLTITRPAGTTTTNFEAGASVTPSIGPGGTAVVVKAYGYKPQRKTKHPCLQPHFLMVVELPAVEDIRHHPAAPV